MNHTMIITLPKNYKSGQEYEFQPTSAQKKALERARNNRKKGEVITLG